MNAGLTDEDVQIEYLNNHENVIIGTLLGEYDAGASAEEVFRENEVKGGLKAFAYSPPYLSTHVFVTSSKMDTKLQAKIKKALIDLNRDQQGDRNLKGYRSYINRFCRCRRFRL